MKEVMLVVYRRKGEDRIWIAVEDILDKIS